MSSELTPDPWEYPPELRNKRKDYTSDEFLDLVDGYEVKFGERIPLGYGINEVAAPVIAYAMETDDPKFFNKWADQVMARSAEHGLVF